MEYIEKDQTDLNELFAFDNSPIRLSSDYDSFYLLNCRIELSNGFKLSNGLKFHNELKFNKWSSCVHINKFLKIKYLNNVLD